MKNKLFITFGIFAIALAIAGIVYAQSQSGLENELNNLIENLNSQGYDWLVNYSGDLPSDNCQYVSTIEGIQEEKWYKTYLTGLGECYDNETEILTNEGWKYFYDLTGDEEVATLNSETGELEWQLPMEWQEFDNSDEMYKIELEDGSGLLVSEEHRVYIKEKEHNYLVSIVMMSEFVENKNVVFNFEHENKTSDMNSFIIAEISPEIFKMINKSDITIDELIYLFSNGQSKYFVFASEFIEDFFQCGSNNELKTHFKPIKESNSSKVIGFISPDLSFLEVCSVDSIISLTIEDLTSRESFSEISEISSITDNFKFVTNCLMTLDKANSNSCLNSAGMSTLTTISSINNQEGEEYINLSDFELKRIIDIDLDKEIYFMNSENEPVRVVSIFKENYNGKIYDVDVENDIVLVRRRTADRENDFEMDYGNVYEKENKVNDFNIGSGDKQLINNFGDNNLLAENPDDAGFGAINSEPPSEVNLNEIKNNTYDEKENKRGLNVTPTIRDLSLDFNNYNDKNYINFSVDNDFAEEATLTLMVRDRSNKSGLFSRQPGSTPGRGASALSQKKYLELNGELIDVTGAVWSGNSNSYDTFDLKINCLSEDCSGVEFDYIVDPFYLNQSTNGTGTNITIENQEFAHLNISDASLVAYYPFDVLDGNGTWVAGNWSNALEFDGVDDYVSLGSAVTFANASNYTINFWVKRNAYGDTVLRGLFGNYGTAGYNHILFNGYNVILIETNTNSDVARTNTLGVNDNNWHMYSIVTNSSNIIKVYQDITEQSMSDNTITNGIILNLIGRGSGYYFNGSIDEVRIFNYALNETEIQELYENNNVLNETALVGYWDLNEVEGLVARDTSGNNNDGDLTGYGDDTRYTYDYTNQSNDGTINGNLFYNSSAGYYGGAYEFDGVDDYVSVGNPNSLNLSDNFSVSVWVKSIENGVYQGILTKQNSALNGGWSFVRRDSNYFDILISNSTGSKAEYISSNSQYTDSNWHHLVMRANNSVVYLFVDGVLQTDYSTSIDMMPQNRNLMFGRFYSDSTNFLLNGSIDEVMIFNRSLSEQEIGEIYNSSYSRFYPTGEMLFENLSFGSNNSVNITLDNCQTLNGSYLQGKINENEWTNFSGCSFTDYSFTPTGSDNFSIKFLSTPYNFYSPLVIGNISLEDQETDQTAPIIEFISQTPDDGATNYNNEVNINTTITDDSETSAWIDWNKSLVGYWGMDNYNSTGVYDNSSYSNFGKFNGGQSNSNISNGVRGNALSFDGVNDYVLLSDKINFSQRNFTISMWVKIGDNSIADYQTIFGKGLRPNTANGEMALSIYQDDIYFLYRNESDEYDFVQINNVVLANTWSHIVLINNGSTNLIYIDDAEATYGNRNFKGGIYDGGGNNWIGTSSSIIGAVPYRQFNGSIDEVMIFNRSLSVSEIQALYNNSQYRLDANISNLADGTYNYSVYAIDQAGNLNITSPDRQITILTLVPAPTNITWLTTGGFTDDTLGFMQIIDYINATCTGSSLEGCNLTLAKPDGILAVNNSAMSNYTGDVWNYTTDITLNVAGNWTLNVTSYSGSISNTTTTSFNVSTYSFNLTNKWYGYSGKKILNSSEITDNLFYDFTIYEFEENMTSMASNFSSLVEAINDCYDLNVYTGVNYILNYDINDSALNEHAKLNISENMSYLLNSPYVITLKYISLEVADIENYNDTQIYTVLNDLAENITDKTENKFVVYSKNYNTSSLNNFYIRATPMIYIEPSDEAGFINLEAGYFKNSSSINRIYEGVSSALKLSAKSFYNGILKVLRSTPDTSIVLEPLVSVLSNGDVLVFNNESSDTSTTVNVTNVTSVSGKDVWDYTNKLLIEKDSDLIFDVNVSNYSATMLFFDDFDHLQMESNSLARLFKGASGSEGYSNYTDGERTDSWPIAGAYDILIELFDPHYINSGFSVYYGWLNVSYLSTQEMCEYNVSIIADKNSDEVSKILGNCSDTELYGYISVADYDENDQDNWFSSKTSEIDSWLDVNSSMHLFIDGLDSGISGANFSTRMQDLVDYTQITKGRKAILNTYTAYEDFATLGTGGVMKESCVNRWNGENAGAPSSYSREDWDLELNKSTWYTSHGIDVFCMAFNNRTTDNSYIIKNYTELQDIYFASKVLGYKYFYLAQPDFLYHFYEHVYDVGEDMSNSYETDDDETYYRRYSKGVVYYNSSSGRGWFEDGRVINSAEICFDLYDSTYMTEPNFEFTINNPQSTGSSEEYSIADDIDSGAWATRCVDISGEETNGRYLVEAWVDDHVIPAGQGFALGNDVVSGMGRHSYYDTSSTDSWITYEMGKNWVVNISVNETKKASVDTTTRITQTNSSFDGFVNLTLSADADYELEIWSNPVNVTGYSALSYYNGTDFIAMNPLSTSTCDTDAPSWASDSIGGETHKSCYYTSGSDTLVRVALPSLSTREYNITVNDTDSPRIEFISPTENTNVFESKNYIYANVSVSDSALDDLSYYLFNNSYYPSDSLVGYWKLDGNGLDSSGNGNTGTLTNGPVNASDNYSRQNAALSFDGADDYVLATSVNLGTNNTISYWMNANAFNKIAISGPSYNYLYHQTASVFLYRAGSGTAKVMSISPILSTSTWYNIVLSRQDTNITLYINGNYMNWTTLTENNNFTFTTIGGYNPFYWNGSLDEVMIYNRSLSSSEISDLYNRGLLRHNVTAGTTEFNWTDVSEGGYDYFVVANDSNNNLNSTELRNIILDTTKATIEFISPTLDDGSYSNKNYFEINTTITDDSETSAWIDWDKSLVGYWGMDNYNSTGLFDNSSYCYDNETEILTNEGWKYFYDLTGDEEVATLNSETGELEWQLPMEWQEFDNDEEMYKIILEDGSDLLVSEKHRVYSSEDNLFSISLGENTLSEEFNSPLSPDNIEYFVASDNATYGASLSCGASSLALGKNDMNSSKGINVISLIKNSYTSSNSDSENFVNLSILDLFCLTSSNKNSGAINSNSLINELIEKTECDTPLLINDEIITLASTISLSDIFYNEEYLLDKETLISSANLSACDCVNCDLETALLNLINLERLSRNNLLINKDTSNLGNSLNSDSSSLGISISMNNSKNPDYINLSDFNLFNLQPIKEVYSNLKNGEEIYFLNSENEPVRVVSIFKENYNGKIYDVDVENDIVLVRRNHNESIKFFNSSVLNTVNSDCSLKCGSLDQIGIFNSNANARNETSLLCEINLSALSLKNCEGSLNSINSESKAVSFTNLSLDMPDFEHIIFEYLYNSSIRFEGANNSKENSLNNLFVKEFDLNNEKTMLVSTTNFIYSSLDIDFLNSLPSLMQSSSVNLDFSKSFSNFSNISSCNIFLTNASLAKALQLSHANFSILFLTSSGRDNVTVGILSPDMCNMFNYLYSVKAQEVFKSSVFDNKGIWSGNSNFGTFNGGIGTANLTNGKRGLGLEFDGVGDYVDLGSVFNIGKEHTLSTWFKLKASPNNDNVIVGGTSNYYYLADIYALGNSIYYAGDGTNSVGVSWTEDTSWHHLSIVRNQTSVDFYLDGSQLGTTQTLAGNNDALYRYIGEMNSKYFFGGSLDEVLIFNRSLSASEISALYDNSQYRLSANITNLNTDSIYNYSVYAIDQSGNLNITSDREINIDFTAPQVSLVYPENASYNSSLTELNYTYSDLNSGYCWYSNDSGVTNSSSVTAGENFTISSIENSNTFIVYCNDSAGNENLSSVTFIVDTIYPQIEFGTGMEDNNSYVSQDWTFVNVSVNDTNAGSIFVNWDNSLIGWWRFENDSSIGENDSLFVDLSDFSNNGTCSGTNCPSLLKGKLGNARDFNNDKITIPFSQEFEFGNETSLTISSWVKLDGDQGDWAGIFSTGGSSSNYWQIYITTSNVFAIQMSDSISTSTTTQLNDSQWHLVTAVINRSISGTQLYVDGIAEGSPANTPDNITTENEMYIGYERTGSYLYDGLIDDVMIFNRSLSQDEIFSIYNATIYSHNFTGLNEGNYDYKAYSQDTAGHLNSTETRIINLDTTIPNVAITAPTASHTLTSASATFTATTSENSTCEYSLDAGVTNYSLTANSAGTSHTATRTLTNANYVLNVYCDDLAGNSNNTQNVSFTVAVSSPVAETTQGGGGGAAAVFTPSFGFKLIPENYERTISLNKIEFDKFTLTNLGDLEEQYNFEISALENILLIDVSSIKVSSKDSRDIEFRITSPKETGIYTGKIIATSGSLKKEILTTINVKTEKSLFDVILTLPERMKAIKPGHNLGAQIDLIQMGIKEKMDVTIYYVIKDFNGNTLLTESETIAVEDQKMYYKEFYTKELPPGDYVLGIEVIYPEGVAVASSQFKVKDKLRWNFSTILMISLALAVLFVFVAISILIKRYKKYTKHLRRRR